MIDLPDVTFIMVETRDYGLARLTALDALEKVRFGDVLICTNSSSGFAIDEARYLHVEDWSSKLDWCRFIWHGLPRYVRTPFMLLCQYDAGVWDTAMWRDEYLAYDYVGAPWWYPVKNVGNSGFCLKSTRLARYLQDRAWEFPCDSPLEDDLLCRKYRPILESRGFRWAPERVARQFAFECTRPSSDSRHFGYHAMFNWPFVLTHEQVLERLQLACESPSIRDSYMMKAFCERHPAIIREFVERQGNASDLSVPRQAVA